jgi:NAD-dependent SIR2 family protein deacetylase
MGRGRVVVVVVECVDCGATREVGPGEVAADEVPMCRECGSPMVAKTAKVAPPKRGED